MALLAGVIVLPERGLCSAIHFGPGLDIPVVPIASRWWRFGGRSFLWLTCNDRRLVGGCDVGVVIANFGLDNEHVMLHFSSEVLEYDMHHFTRVRLSFVGNFVGEHRVPLLPKRGTRCEIGCRVGSPGPIVELRKRCEEGVQPFVFVAQCWLFCTYFADGAFGELMRRRICCAEWFLRYAECTVCWTRAANVHVAFVSPYM